MIYQSEKVRACVGEANLGNRARGSRRTRKRGMVGRLPMEECICVNCESVGMNGELGGG
jgi:hypothetical protein